jgi:aspartyl-tRNA(Asn)/glutamyl-tRNA(Gln) amidotransferase subunit A
VKLFDLTISQLSELINKKEVSVLELTTSMLERIRNVDPKIDCYINIIEEKALKRASEVQEKLDKGELKSPLTGIPMAVKDNICTEGIPTTCGSKMLSSFIPPYDATVIKKLYDNGAILLGKLNMDEFAMGSTTESSYFKHTKNPWNVERVPGGSSGGSAAAVAAGEAIYSLGSDTGGSIRQPASFCGVVGMKPTYGSVSRFGLVACASSFDQIGPISKDVTDCAIVLNAITGQDPMDSTSYNTGHPDYTKFLVNDVKGVKIGIPKEFMNANLDEDIRKAFLKAIEILKNLGAECEEFSIPIMEYVIPVYYIVSFAEASSNLGRYDGIRFGHRAKDYTDLEDLYKKSRGEAFGAEVKRRILIGTYVLSSDQYDKYYKKALQARRVISEKFNKAFEKYDIIIGPTSPVTAFRFGEMTDYDVKKYKGDMFTVPANIVGFPAMTVPCGMDKDGFPIGLQFMGKHFNESMLIKAAYTFEQSAEFHKNKPVI